MTLDEAIALLIALKNGLHETGKDFPYRDEIIPILKEALDMAIEALEQENSYGCCGCAFEDIEEWEMPCSKCKRGCNDYWRPKKERSLSN